MIIHGRPILEVQLHLTPLILDCVVCYKRREACAFYPVFQVLSPAGFRSDRSLPGIGLISNLRLVIQQEDPKVYHDVLEILQIAARATMPA